MNYVKPIDVRSPRDYVQDVEVLYDGKALSFSLAKLTWEDNERVYAIRWNASMREQLDIEKQNGNKTCVGVPSSHGIPVWFVLPEQFNKHIPSVLSELNKH
jgi:hypothetical protein